MRILFGWLNIKSWIPGLQTLNRVYKPAKSVTLGGELSEFIYFMIIILVTSLQLTQLHKYLFTASKIEQSVLQLERMTNTKKHQRSTDDTFEHVLTVVYIVSMYITYNLAQYVLN